jgi:hypothetical protein
MATIEDPAEIQNFLSQIRGVDAGFQGAPWWLWWSPSDLVAHGIDDLTIARYLRAIAKDFESTTFVALVAESAHTERGLAIMRYVARVWIEVRIEQRKGEKPRWIIRKHPESDLKEAELSVE